jgi:protein archease
MEILSAAPDRRDSPEVENGFVHLHSDILMTARFYRILEHTADTGFEVKADTLAQLYEYAACAFFDIMWLIDSPEENQPQFIEVTGIDPQQLLVKFLEEFLYFYDAKGKVCTGVKVEKVSDTRILARASLQKFDEKRDRELLSVKAVTYHQLFIGRVKGTWLAKIFLDI